MSVSFNLARIMRSTEVRGASPAIMEVLSSMAEPAAEHPREFSWEIFSQVRREGRFTREVISHKPSMLSVEDIIARLGGAGGAASRCGVGLEAVRKWRQARAVPAKHWPTLLAYTGLTLRTCPAPRPCSRRPPCRMIRPEPRPRHRTGARAHGCHGLRGARRRHGVLGTWLRRGHRAGGRDLLQHRR